MFSISAKLETFEKRITVMNILITIFYFIIIGLITSNIIELIYGELEITFRISEMDISLMVASFIVFVVISVIFLFIERSLLPFLLITSPKRKSRYNLEDKWVINTKRILQSRFRFNPYEKLSDLKNAQLAKYKLGRFIMFFPVMIILILVAINHLWSYLLIIPVVVLMILFYSIFNNMFSLYLDNESDSVT